MRRHFAGCLVAVMMFEGAAASMAEQESADDPNAAIESLRLEDLTDRIASLERRLDELAKHARLEAVQVQTGTVRLPYSAGARPVVRTWSGGGRDRGIVDGRVDFLEAFVSAPEVHMALSMLDMDGGRNTRISVVVTAVDEEGFDYQLWSWSDTHIYTADAVWIAVAK